MDIDYRKLSKKIVVDDAATVSSIWLLPAKFNGDVMIFAHGAGTDMHNPFIAFFHEAMAEKGMLSIKFNFPYKELGRKAPDRSPKLEQTWQSVLQAVHRQTDYPPKRVFAAGKSMGGRIASLVASRGEPLDGLVFLGYPLHPPKKFEKLRAAHLKEIRCPMLFIQGTRDTLCDLELLRKALEPLNALSTLRIIEGGDHSFKVLKRHGRTEVEVWQEIVDTILVWRDENILPIQTKQLR